MQHGIESVILLVTCCEGDSSNLTEEIYYKQLHKYIKATSPKWIRFNQIEIIKMRVNEVLNTNRLIEKLTAKSKVSEKFSSIVIWKANDEQPIIQEQNNKICLMEDKLFKKLKKYLILSKRTKENFKIWLLPRGWNFETFYRNHFIKKLNISDRELKENFKKHDYFLKKLFLKKILERLLLS